MRGDTEIWIEEIEIVVMIEPANTQKPLFSSSRVAEGDGLQEGAGGTLGRWFIEKRSKQTKNDTFGRAINSAKLKKDSKKFRLDLCPARKSNF
ncbi:MAG: hypothetical protein LBB52_06050 [Desulfovibrio sp.]|jgi:hypothetical protein|nr:hypothetical protein [Desulfovibrio sp.]